MLLPPTWTLPGFGPLLDGGPGALVAVVGAAVLLAAGTGIQSRTTGRSTWWVGTAVLGAGSALGAAALVLAPVSVVQPVGILALPLTVGWAAWRARSRVGVPRALAVACCVLGVLGLVVLVVTAEGARVGRPDPGGDEVAVVGSLVLLVAGVFAAVGSASRSNGGRVMLLTVAAGTAFGAVAVLTRLTLVPMSGGEYPAVSTVTLLPLLLSLGLWALHRARQAGRHALLVATLTLVDPVVAVLLGAVLLEEALPSGAAAPAALAAPTGSTARHPSRRSTPPPGRGSRHAPHLPTKGVLA